MIAALLTLNALTVLAAVHSVLFSASSSWYYRQASLWRTDYQAALARAASKPRRVRYTDWLDRKVSAVVARVRSTS